jgi:hypothetical protein
MADKAAQRKMPDKAAHRPLPDKETLRAIVNRMAPVSARLYIPDGARGLPDRNEEAEPSRADEAQAGWENELKAYWRRIGESPDFADCVREIRAEGERLLASPVPELTYGLFAVFERTGSRLEYERAYFERRRRLNTFVFLSLLEPDNGKVREALYESIWAVLNEYTWCLPAHVKGRDARKTIDLFAAETGFALSEIRCLLGDRLPPLLRAWIGEEVSARLFEPYLQGGPFEWETARHNWSAVCAGSVGAAALLTMEDKERLAIVLAKALGSMNCYLEGFGDDGACPEGLGYWNYGFGYFVYFADLLKKRTEGAIDLFRNPKVRSIALFQQKAYLCGDRVANFSDSPSRVPVRIGLSHYLASLYPEAEVPHIRYRAAYTDDHCSRFAPALRDFIWREPGRTGSEWGDASAYLPDAAWLVSRHADKNGRRYGFAAKGGHNGEPHNHNDVGHFIVMADGAALAADLGAGEYTEAYFGEARYTYDCNGSQGHSVPIVDGRGQEAGADRAAVVLEASAGAAEDRLRLEMARVYGVPHLRSLVRELVWRKTETPVLALRDEFVFDSPPGSIVERIVTLFPPELEADGCVRLRAGAGGPCARIRYDGAALEPSFERRSYRDHFGKETAWYAVDFALRTPGRVNRIELTVEISFG